jgi:hypothetical protein
VPALFWSAGCVLAKLTPSIAGASASRVARSTVARVLNSRWRGLDDMKSPLSTGFSVMVKNEE